VIRVRYLVLFAAVFYVCLLLIMAPASLLDLTIQRVSNGRLSLSNSQGTIWHGSATPTLHTGKDSTIALHTLHWTIRPQALLLGQLKVYTNWDDMPSATPMTLTLTRKTASLTNLLLPLPAEVISELSPFLKPAQFSGNLALESPQLIYTGNHLLGNVTARWNQAGSAMSAVHPLGDYQINIVAAQDSLRAALTTRNGALLLDGQGSWSPTQKFHFNGTARATPAAQPMLSELLHHLGPEAAPGVYQISL
jgi:general secretion pathway protein N